MILFRNQKGAALVEAAAIGFLFFLLIFGIFEFARLLFTLNTFGQVTRRAARVATVCPPNHPLIKYAAVFGDPNSTTTGDILPGLTIADIDVKYFDGSGNDITSALTYPIPANAQPGDAYTVAWQSLSNGGSVSASIATGYNHKLIVLPFTIQLNKNNQFIGNVFSGNLSTLLPAEALGVVNDPAGVGAGAGTDICTFP